MDNNQQTPIRIIVPEMYPSRESPYGGMGGPMSYPQQTSTTYTDVQESTVYSTQLQPQATAIPVVPLLTTPSVFPAIQPPQGPLISVFIEDNSHHQKRNRRVVGVGVAAAACAVPGGLIVLPALAGFAINKVVKKNREKCVYAYGNSYVFELRAALARGLGVPPELLQLKRKGVMLEDCSYLGTYLEYAGKQRIHIAMHVKDHPVAGSVCQFQGQYEYPPVQYIDCSSYQFVVFRVCLEESD